MVWGTMGMLDRGREDLCATPTGSVGSLATVLARSSEIAIPEIDPLTPLLTMRSVGYNGDAQPVFESRPSCPDPRIEVRLVRRRAGLG